METKINQAVILAAGRGTRMGTITETVPKPMLSIGGRPMLEHILERLSAAGLYRFFIVVGYRHELIEQYFKSSRFQVSFAVQDPVDGTGSAARLAQPFVSDEPFLLTFGDILCPAAEYSQAAGRLDHDTQAVVAVKAVDDPWQGAAVYEESGRITRMIEKPPKGTSTTAWNSAGIYCFRSSIFPYLAALQPSSRHEYEITAAIGAMLADGLPLKISPIEGEWRDVGRPEDLAALNS